MTTPSVTPTVWRLISVLFVAWFALGTWDTYRYVVAPPEYEMQVADGEWRPVGVDAIDDFEARDDPDNLDALDDFDDFEALETGDAIEDGYFEEASGLRDDTLDETLDAPVGRTAPPRSEAPVVFEGSGRDSEPTLGSLGRHLQERTAEDARERGDGLLAEAPSDALARNEPYAAQDAPVVFEGTQRAEAATIESLRARVAYRFGRDAADPEAAALRDDVLSASDAPVFEPDSELEIALEGGLDTEWVSDPPRAFRLARAPDFIPRMYALAFLQALIGALLLFVAYRRRQRWVYAPGGLLLAAGLVAVAAAMSDGSNQISLATQIPSRPFPVLACALLALRLPRFGRRIAVLLGLAYAGATVAFVLEWGPEPHWVAGTVFWLAALGVGAWSCAWQGRRERTESAPAEGPFRTTAAPSADPTSRPPRRRLVFHAVMLSLVPQLLAARMPLGFQMAAYSYQVASVSIACLIGVCILLSHEAGYARDTEGDKWRHAAISAWAVYVMQLAWVTLCGYLYNRSGSELVRSLMYGVVLSLGLGLQLVFLLRALHASMKQAWPEFRGKAPTSGQAVRIMFGAAGLCAMAILFRNPMEYFLASVATCICMVAVGGSALWKLGRSYTRDIPSESVPASG